MQKIFLLKCTLPMLRLVPFVMHGMLPIALSYLTSFHKHDQPPRSLLAPTIDALVLSAFPIAWFFAFMYYTDVPSLLFVSLSVAFAMQRKHAMAGLVCVQPSYAFAQLNIFLSLRSSSLGF